jgi:hypothetical protein
MPAFDSYVESHMRELIDVLSSDRTLVLLLGVPIVDPAPAANGAPLPQASLLRHQLVNQLLASAAKASGGRAQFFSLDPLTAPHGHYSTNIDGHDCRSVDGIHFTPRCGSYLQPWLFGQTRSLASSSSADVGTGARHLGR